jgi:hypothetical protein
MSTACAEQQLHLRVQAGMTTGTWHRAHKQSPLKKNTKDEGPAPGAQTPRACVAAFSPVVGLIRGAGFLLILAVYAAW